MARTLLELPTICEYQIFPKFLFKLPFYYFRGVTEEHINLNVAGKANIISTSVQPGSLEQIHALEHGKKKKRTDEEEFIIIDKPAFGPNHNFKSAGITIKEGDPLHLETSLSPVHDPSMKVEWFLNGSLLKVGHRFKSLHDFGYVALDILYAYPEDSGTYTVKATNDLGEVTLTTSVTVLEKKTIDSSTMLHDSSLIAISQIERSKVTRREIELPPDTSPPVFSRHLRITHQLREGQAALFEAIVTPANDPTMEVVWTHNGRPITTGHRFVAVNEFGYVALKILYVYEEDSGVYTVR